MEGPPEGVGNHHLWFPPISSAGLRSHPHLNRATYAFILTRSYEQCDRAGGWEENFRVSGFAAGTKVRADRSSTDAEGSY